MSKRRRPRHHRARVLGIALLILGLAHAPLPRADFHNVRHHDAPGEVCEHHDHLLRWHPDAGQAEDVAILHWHWLLPSSDPAEAGHSGTGLALHAYVAGDGEATSPESGPVVAPETASRLVAPAPPALLLSFDAAIPAHPVDGIGLRDGPRPAVRAFGATFAPRVSFSAWLQRWSC